MIYNATCTDKVVDIAKIRISQRVLVAAASPSVGAYPSQGTEAPLNPPSPPSDSARHSFATLHESKEIHLLLLRTSQTS